jgi:hypothetical protein
LSDQLEKIRGIIGSILRIGLGGPQIKATGGNLEMRNAVDGGFVITRGADPVGSDDLVTKRYGVATYGAPLLFGAGDVGVSATTRYLFPSYEDDLAQTIAIQIEVERAGTLRNLRVRHNVVGGTAVVITYTVRKNGVATALAMALAANASAGSDLVNSVAVVAGDRLDIEVTKAVLGGASPNDITASLELAA